VEKQLQALNSALHEEVSFNPLHLREKNPLKLGILYLKRVKRMPEEKIPKLSLEWVPEER
jgi:hypothetical protein